MDYYNTISGPSSRPYDPNGYSNPSGSSTTPSSQSPQFPSYPMMTDLDPPYNNNSINRVQHIQHMDDDDNDIEVEAEVEGEGEGSTGIEIDDSGPLVEPHQDLDSFLESFWTRQMAVVERDNPDFKTYPLPLARIKKVMKSDEDVKMISAEVPIMFSKACEIFISELTCRAWLIAETNKRRTLQKADVANAIAASDMFDFLIDIIPRDDGSTAGSGGPGGVGTGNAVGQMTGTGVVGGGGVQVPEAEVEGDGEGLDEDDDERVFTEFVRQEEIG